MKDYEHIAWIVVVGIMSLLAGFIVWVMIMVAHYFGVI